MWNLFSTVQPKVLQPSRSMKEHLLQEQARCLQQIQYDAKRMLQSINTILKSQAQQQSVLASSKEQSIGRQIKNLEETINSLHKKLMRDNNKFQQFISQRDQQKLDRNLFFKQTMRGYQHKKTQLNKYIQELQDKVQQLQLQGYKIYELNPKPNGVLVGINANYIQKFLAKVQETHKIKQGIKGMLGRGNRQCHQQGKAKARTQGQPQSGLHEQAQSGLQQQAQSELQEQAQTKAQEQAQTKAQEQICNSGRVVLTPVSGASNSLNDLERQLEMILLKEQILGSMIDERINNCKKKFRKLAAEQQVFKQALKKVEGARQQKKRSPLRHSTTCKALQQSNSALPVTSIKKTSSSFEVQSSKVQQLTKSLDPLFCEQKVQPTLGQEQPALFNLDYQEQQLQIQIQMQGQAEQSEQRNEDEQMKIPSQNFIQACEFLITDRFVEEDDGQGNMQKIDQQQEIQQQ